MPGHGQWQQAMEVGAGPGWAMEDGIGRLREGERGLTLDLGVARAVGFLALYERPLATAVASARTRTR